MSEGSPERAPEAAAPADGGAGAVALAEAFRAAFRFHPAGAAIVTGEVGEGPVALTVSSLISVSAAPATIAFSLSESSASARALARAETVVVHFVRRKDMHLARLCATSGAERFGGSVRWKRLATGEPCFEQVTPWFRAAIRGRLACPGAVLVTAVLLQASPGIHDGRDGETLVYANRTWHGLRPIADAASAPLFLWPDDSATF